MPNMDGWKRSVEAEIQKAGQAEVTAPCITDEVAWSDVRVEAIRSLRSRANEHDRIAGLGGQSSEEMQRRLVEMGHPTYAQQAVAERALADQIAALPLLAPQPVVDREALGKAIEQAASDVDLAKYFLPGTTDRFVDAVLALMGE